MSRESLRFEELQIRQSPGFEREGFTLRGLSPGINLIYGPNGAGKSTTARAVARLLWPALEGADRVSLRGRFRLADAEWNIDLDGSRAQYEREGMQAAAPLLPSSEGHQRYQLSLHDLLRARDEGFAAAVARESAGGYDVRRSGAVLEPRTLVSRRNALNDALDRARAEYDEAVALQQELRAQERDLVEQRNALAAAKEAQRRVTLLQAALDHARALEGEVATRAELEKFATAMERLGGDEYDRLCRLRESVRKVEEDRREMEKAAADARARVESLALPDAALREELLFGLEEDFETLQTAAQEVERAKSSLARALARRDAEASRLGDAVDAERLSAAGLATIATVAGFARRANTLATRRNTVEAQLRLLEAAPAEDGSVRVEEGIRLLRRWLREPGAASAVQPAAGRTRGAGVAAALLLTVLGIVLAVVAHPLFSLVALLGGVLLVMLWPRSPAAPTADAREVHRRDYGKLDLEDPAAWEPRAVETLLGGLEERGVRAREAALQQRRRREMADELEAIAVEENHLETERRRIAADLGVAPPETRPVELAWVMETLVRWQAAQAEVVGEEAALRAAEAHSTGVEESLRARLEAIGYGAPTTQGELAGAIRAFGERRQALQAERDRRQSAESTLRRLEEDRDRQEQEIQRLFDSLGLAADSDETVRVWCEERGAYRRVYEAYRHAESVLGSARGRLEALGADETLMSLPAEALQQRLETEVEHAAQRDLLSQAITATETLIDRAKRSHDVEEALQRVEQAEEALRRAREKDVRAAIAQALIDALERATRDQQLPAVFRRARELFSRITQGRYELRLRQEGVPEFTAVDQIERRGRSLDQLSSGTRVQLLLAVRIAFVEQQEQGVKLPLLLDEVLGNSDDERARAIMEAVVELSREGRQIFYFTAQMDEVARWRALFAEDKAAGVELREIDLLQVRGLERQLEIPFVVPPARTVPPVPAGAGHAEYGRRLEVPRLDRAADRAASVHLWYLVEDPEMLHRLLMLGADRWGPLDALVRNGGRPLIDDRTHEELQLTGRVAEAFFEAASTGIGRRVDRAALEDSQAVTATFLDRVDTLAQTLDGDAQRLVDALERGQVPRFGRASKEALRAYFEERGYLTREQPLGLAEVRAAVLSRLASDVAAGSISLERLDRLVGRLWLGVGGE